MPQKMKRISFKMATSYYDGRDDVDRWYASWNGLMVQNLLSISPGTYTIHCTPTTYTYEEDQVMPLTKNYTENPFILMQIGERLCFKQTCEFSNLNVQNSNIALW